MKATFAKRFPFSNFSLDDKSEACIREINEHQINKEKRRRSSQAINKADSLDALRLSGARCEPVGDDAR
jgi:hypothetical protein